MKVLLLLPLTVLLFQTGTRPAGSIEGTITRADSSQVIAGARVTVTRRLTPNVPAAIPPVTTDDSGKFVVPGLEDGAYSIQVQANGYLARAYATPGATASLINVNGGQPTKGINVALTPAASIAGRVLDTADQPLVNGFVQLLRYSYDNQGRRSYQSLSATPTNDRGEYRIDGVTPGRYYLLASTRGVDYAFYPGVLDIANAATIDLQSGSDLQAVDIKLEARPRTFKISGKIVDSRNDQPPGSANISVASQMPGSDRVDFRRLPGSDYNGKTGFFEIRDLLPGTYSIVAFAFDRPAGWSAGLVPVNIESSNIDGLTIPLVPAGGIPGRVRIDGPLPAQMAIDRLLVRLVPVGANTQTSLSGAMATLVSDPTFASLGNQTRTLPPGSPLVSVGADGAFQLANIVPGDYRIEFHGFPLNGAGGTQYAGTMQMANAYIKDARFDGADVLNAPLRFSGASNNGLEVTLAFGAGRVVVTVTDARFQPVRSGRVVAVPERARFRTDLFRPLSTDENGQSGFVLPPGDYRIFAWESIEENAWLDPDILARIEGRATSVHISEGSNLSANVQIIPADSKP